MLIVYKYGYIVIIKNSKGVTVRLSLNCDGIIHLIEWTELISWGCSCNDLYSSGAVIVGKFNTQTKRVKREESADARCYARYVTEIAKHDNQ